MIAPAFEFQLNCWMLLQNTDQLQARSIRYFHNNFHTTNNFFHYFLLS